MRAARALAHWLALAIVVAPSQALKEHDFRKCRDTPFCQKHRNEPPPPTAVVDAASVAFDAQVLTARIMPALPQRPLPLQLSLSVLPSGAVRVKIDEDPAVPLSDLERADPSVPKPEAWDDDMDGEWEAPMIKLGRAVKPRFSPTDALASSSVLNPSSHCERVHAVPGEDGLRCAVDGGVVEVRLVHSPLAMTILRDGEAVAVLNGRGRLLFEPFQQAIASETAESSPPTPPHTFNSFTDEMVYGSSSVGLDVDFPSATSAYGLPERTVAHALPSTLGREPYRLFNLDVFEYLLDHPMGVYGSVPFLQAHGDAGSYGMLWLNPSETWVDLGCAADGATSGATSGAASETPGSGTGGSSEGGAAAGAEAGSTSGVCSHWYSASGLVDALVFTGPRPHDVTRQHAALTGVSPLPPLFALGYHQCRWNYRDEADVRMHGFLEPCSSLWLMRGDLEPRSSLWLMCLPPRSPAHRSLPRVTRSPPCMQPLRSTTCRWMCCGSTSSTPTASATSRGTLPSSATRHACRRRSRTPAARWSPSSIPTSRLTTGILSSKRRAPSPLSPQTHVRRRPRSSHSAALIAPLSPCRHAIATCWC